jgi:hypothetical protein
MTFEGREEHTSTPLKQIRGISGWPILRAFVSCEGWGFRRSATNPSCARLFRSKRSQQSQPRAIPSNCPRCSAIPVCYASPAHCRASSPANLGQSRPWQPELPMQRKTERPVGFHGNYRSGIIPHRYASIASTRANRNAVARKAWPPAKKGLQFGRAL